MGYLSFSTDKERKRICCKPQAQFVYGRKLILYFQLLKDAPQCGVRLRGNGCYDSVAQRVWMKAGIVREPRVHHISAVIHFKVVFLFRIAPGESTIKKLPA